MVFRDRIDLFRNGQTDRGKTAQGQRSARCGLLRRLKAIGVNLFRAARVKRVLDAFITAPRTLAEVVCTTKF